MVRMFQGRGPGTSSLVYAHWLCLNCIITMLLLASFMSTYNHLLFFWHVLFRVNLKNSKNRTFPGSLSFPCINYILTEETFLLRSARVIYERKTKDYPRSWSFQHKSWPWRLLGFVTISFYKDLEFHLRKNGKWWQIITTNNLTKESPAYPFLADNRRAFG